MPSQIPTPIPTTDHQTRMSLPTLPNELLSKIGESLEPNNLAALILTCHLLRDSLTPSLNTIGLQDYNSTSAIIWAIEHGHEHLCRLILDNGYPVNTNTGSTPLLHAVQLGNMAIVRLLLKKGADTGSTDNAGDTALVVAVRMGRVGICRLLLQSGANAVVPEGRKPLLHLALANGGGQDASCYPGEAMIKLLLGDGASSENRDACGARIVGIVGDKLFPWIVKLLVKAGAEIDFQDKDGQTALHIAAVRGHCHTLLVLLQHGAKTDLQNRQGKTPLHYAALSDRALSLVQTLLDYGASPNIQNHKGETPLHVAARKGHDREVVEALVGGGAWVWVRNNQGETPLHLAAGAGCLFSVYLLLEHGADRLWRNNMGFIPETVAQLRGHESVVARLRLKS